MEVKCQRFGKSSDMSSEKATLAFTHKQEGKRNRGRMDLAKEKGGDIIGKAN